MHVAGGGSHVAATDGPPYFGGHGMGHWPSWQSSDHDRLRRRGARRTDARPPGWTRYRPPLPAPFLVRSAIRYVWPGSGVGGSGLPRVAVRSWPVGRPWFRISYCPEAGAVVPGFKVFIFVSHESRFGKRARPSGGLAEVGAERHARTPAAEAEKNDAGYPVWMGVRRPFIIRMTIGRPQLQRELVQSIADLL